MPRVPVYNPQVAPAAIPGVALSPVNPSSNGLRTDPSLEGGYQAEQLNRLGQGVQSLGNVLTRQYIDAQQQANQVRVDDAVNKAKEAAMRFTFDPEAGYAGLKGEAALNRPDKVSLDQEYTTKLQSQLGALNEGLGNDAQKRAFQMATNDLLTRFRADVQQHMVAQDKVYRQSVQEGTIKTAANAIALAPLDAKVVGDNAMAIKAATYNLGKMMGKSAVEIEAAQGEAVSQVHANALKILMEQQNVDGAKAYFDAYMDQLSGLAKADAAAKLQLAGNALLAMKTADAIWSDIGPKKDGEPVQLDKMEAQAREKFSNDPVKVKDTITELRQRAQAFNAAEGERAAANVNTVMQAYSQGRTLAQLKAMPSFMALPGKQQNDIIQHVSDRAHMLMVRGVEDRNRAEAEQAKKSFGAYLAYSDPNTLAGMSRQQVQALLPSLGNQLTGHLLERFDSLQNKDTKIAATIDKQDFDHIADQMGLKPYTSDKSEDHKRQLGELQYKVETLIDMAQRNKKAPLTRDEKQELMRQEFARTVTVSGWFSNSQKPVIQLTPDDVKSVVVPQAERAQIADALRTMYARNPNNPAYAPTEDNMRRLYLRGKSAAGALIPNGQ